MLRMSGFFAEIMSGWDYWVILVINIFFFIILEKTQHSCDWVWPLLFNSVIQMKLKLSFYNSWRWERERDTLFLVHLRTNNIGTKIWAPSQAWPWCLMNLRITTLSGAIWTEKRALINVYVCKISCFEFRFVFFLCPNITENMGTCN